MTYYIHNVPGRLRITSPVVKHDRGAAAEMVRLLQASIGVKNVVTRATTGSCLIHYDPSVTCQDDLVLLLSREGYFDPSEAITNDEYIRNGAARLLSPLVAFAIGGF